MSGSREEFSLDPKFSTAFTFNVGTSSATEAAFGNPFTLSGLEELGSCSGLSVPSSLPHTSWGRRGF